jgi:DNA sulfur modification protein DndD
MRLDYIKLTNYRQYQEEQIKISAPEKNRNFTIIQGANGTGKTNILNAVTWCLYSKELHMGTKYRGLPIINTRTLNELKSGDKTYVEVELQLFDDEDQRIIIHRKLCFQKLDDGNVRKIPDSLSNCPDGSRIEMMRQIRGDMIQVQDPIFVINKLIPESIQGYFFFDGEQLNDYFKETKGENIKEAVFKISQLSLFEKVIEHLNSRKKDFLKQAGTLSSKAEEIRETLEVYSKSLEQHRKKTNELKIQRDEAEQKEEEFSEKLRTGPDVDVVKAESKCRELEKELEKLENEIEELEKDKYDYLIKYTPTIFSSDPIRKTIEMIGKREEAGDIPPDYKRDFIEKLLKTGKCICGTDINKDKERKKCVEKFLEESSSLEDLSVELTQLYTILKSEMEDLEGFGAKVLNYGKRIDGLDGMRKEKSEELQNKKEIIGKSDVDQVRFWQGKKEEYKKIKNDLIEEISTSKVRADNAEHKMRDLEKKLQQELGKEEKSKEISKKLFFLDDSLEAAINIKNEIMDDLRKEIEEKTKEQFFNLIWKKDTYNDVAIDDNYNISVLHQSGMEGVGTLSAGERQCLALSFMAALNNVSGFNVPILIDTPLGRISKEPKTKIAHNLPSYLKEKQVTLLVIDEEYSAEVRNKLSSRVGKEYRIDFRETADGDYSKVISYE